MAFSLMAGAGLGLRPCAFSLAAGVYDLMRVVSVESRMPSVICSQSSVVSVTTESGWHHRLAKAIDATISSLAADHEVISVTVTPVYAEHYSRQVSYGAMELVGTASPNVIVTVVWREAGGPAVSSAR